MRPLSMTPAHRTGDLAELVCSNSLKSETIDSAQGVLKLEIDVFPSIILTIARKNRVPAGKALSVDRVQFSRDVTAEIEGHRRIRVIREEVTKMPRGPVSIIATGPLTGERLAVEIVRLLGRDSLYFYDAIAPIIEGDSVDLEKAFFGTRYDPEGTDYLNCPLDRDDYRRFQQALVRAEVVRPHRFEEERFFSGCMPIEEIARRGADAPRFGPMRPVGLIDPRNGRRPFAVLQLRREDFGATFYHMVGFQTRLLYPEQERVFRLIPAIEGARFLHFGSMHRNTFINAPASLKLDLSFDRYGSNKVEKQKYFFAGQITGVEGYMESVATGLLAALNAERSLDCRETVLPPPTTMLGALLRYLSRSNPDTFQPINANFGLLPELPKKVAGRRARRVKMAERSLDDLRAWLAAEVRG